MIIDFKFHFWYSIKPLQINIDIKTHLNEKTLWKVSLNLKQPVTWQTAQIWWDAMKSAEFETLPCHFPTRVFWWWKVTEISSHLISLFLFQNERSCVVSKSNQINLWFTLPPWRLQEYLERFYPTNLQKISAKNSCF